MPQMSPMSWMLIYIYIIITLMMFILKIYFMKSQIIQMSENSTKNYKESNWKW